MSKVRDRKRSSTIKRKQKRHGKLRLFRHEYLTTHDKQKKEVLLAKILKIAPDFALSLIYSKETVKDGR